MTTGDMNKPKNVIFIRKSPKAPKNLFLIHDGTGRIEGYFQMVRYLHQDFNIYGVMPIPIEAQYFGPDPFSIRDIAENYRQILNPFIGATPIYIAGWSTGGSIAFEMVSGWRKEGRPVNFLGLLDVLPPDIKINHGFYNIESEHDLWLPYITNESLREKLAKCDQMKAFWEVILSDLTEADWLRERFLSAAENNWTQVIPNCHRLPLHEFFRMINMIRGYYQASLEYRPGSVIEMPVHYFHAVHSVVNNPKDWLPYCQKFIYHQTPGEHYTMLNSDNVPRLCEILNGVLADEPNLAGN